MTPRGERLWEARFGRTAEGIAEFVARRVGEAQMAIEATGATWSFVDRLQEAGATVCVVDTGTTKLKAGFAAKTDRLDARRLADAVRLASVVSLYIPPPALRKGLKKARVALARRLCDDLVRVWRRWSTTAC